MTIATPIDRSWTSDRMNVSRIAIAVLTAATFAVLFARPFVLLLRDWWNDPEVAHGLLLAPLAVFLAWRRGIVIGGRTATVLGLTVLVMAVALRFVSGFAAELFTMRMSMVGAAAGLVLYFMGWRQLRAWWLPFVLIVLAIPIPDLIISAVALPLQLVASELGAALLDARHVPVQLHGNVIRLPGQELFVTEACSGLRSLTALLSLGVLLGAQWLTTVPGRVFLVLLTIPIAILVNSVRVFVTGFVVYHISPEAGTGFLHLTEGWLMFIAALAAVGVVTWASHVLEMRLVRGRVDA